MPCSLLALIVALGFGRSPERPEPADWPEFQPIPIAVTRSSGASVTLPGGPAGRNYLVVVGTPEAGEKPTTVRFEREDVAEHEPVTIDLPPIRPEWSAKLAKRRATMAHSRAQAAPEPSRSSAKFAPKRSFYMMTGDGAVQDVANYRQIEAELVAVGKHCIIYVDKDDAPTRFSREVVNEVISTFDERIQPRSVELFGRHRDVDRNGKFTILFSHWLGDLAGGKVAIGGFVRGGDFYRDVDAPYSNQCDMLYLNSNLKPGPHLRTLIAHEYVHAITFCEHVFGDFLPGEAGLDEEGWLNEGISHLAENLMGAGWSNLDYRISTYLSNPQKYRLAVSDYYRAGLFRCHGCRGATYLMLRWCVDEKGDGLLKELVQSNLAGAENLETAMERPFAELFRQWTIAVSLQGMTNYAGKGSLRSVPLRSKLGNYVLAGPRMPRLVGEAYVGTLAPTSFLASQVPVAAGKTTRLQIETAEQSPVQVTVMRLPDDLGVAELEIAPVAGRGLRDSKSGEVTVAVRHHSGAAVRWERLSWEREVLPQTKENEELPRPRQLAAEEAFVRTVSAAGETILSAPMAVSLRDGNLVFKLIGTDAKGRRVAAWGALSGGAQLQLVPPAPRAVAN
ncbi:MAG TPA: hypothetical protein VNC50_04185 [Planctomycetia bacterium]|nr:hypothetical protein [Planctomycetia bacterium]